MNRSVTIYLLIFLGAFNSLKGQEPSYDLKFFTYEDGLSSQFINSINQDEKGFIWLGTTFGLNRFDGEIFESFTKANSNLKKDRVVETLEDANGNIWTLFYDNNLTKKYTISIFDPILKKAKDFKDVFPNLPFAEEEITNKSFYKNGKDIWFSIDNGSIYKFDGKFTLFAKDKFYQGSKIRIFDDGCWLAQKGYLIQLDKNGNEQKRISILNEDIWDIGLNTNGQIWIAFHQQEILQNKIQILSQNYQENKVLEFHDDNWEERVFNLKYFIDKNGEGRFLFVGKKIFKIFDETGNLVRDFLPQVLEKKSSFISKIVFQDKSGNLWLNTYNELLLLSPQKKLFKKHFADAQFSIRGIIDINEEELFVATYKGFYILNKLTGAKQKIQSNSRYYYGLGIAKLEDEILLGYHFHLYLSYNIQTKKFNYHRQQLTNQINSFFKDKNQVVWVLTNKGLLQLDHKKKEIFYPDNVNLNHPIYQSEINHVFENEEGLWVASYDGLYLINHSGKVLDHFELLDSYQINDSYLNSKDEFWFTTKGNGLLKWNKNNNQLKRFTVKDGLSHDYLYSIDKDKSGFFWIPSNNGLMRFNPSDFSINSFTEADGLTNNEFNTYSRFIDDDGRIYLGGVNGLNSFDPSGFNFIDKENLPLRILSFITTKKESEEVVDRTIELATQNVIHFYPEDKSIDLIFSLIGFKNGQSKYAYQIEGYDKTWNLLKDNKLRINRLPYGNYRLKIKGQSRYGKWSGQQISLPLYVEKPFYLTSNFFILSVIFFSGLIYGLLRLRLIRLEKEKLKLESIVETRTKELGEKAKQLANYNRIKDEFFAIIAHDLRGPVVSFQNISKKIKFLNEEGSQKDVDQMLNFVDEAADNINTLLDNLLNWALIQKGIFPYHPAELNLKKLSNETVQLLEPTAEIKGIRIEQDISDNITVNVDGNAMGMILRNVIGNALKFSSKGDLVKINAVRENGNVLLQIEDSGVGISKDVINNLFVLNEKKVQRGTSGEKGSGLGLVLCKELIDLNKGSINVKSEVKKGTSFIISLPANMTNITH